MNAAKLLPRLTRRNYVTSTANRISTSRVSTMTRSAASRPTVLSIPARQTLIQTSRRAYSSEGAPPAASGGGAWSPLFTALLVFGVGATGYGLYVSMFFYLFAQNIS